MLAIYVKVVLKGVQSQPCLTLAVKCLDVPLSIVKLLQLFPNVNLYAADGTDNKVVGKIPLNFLVGHSHQC